MEILDRARTLKNEVVLQRGVVAKVLKENEKIVLENERLEVLNLIL